MPRLSAWIVRVSLVYLLAGLTLGALLLAQKGIPYSAPIWIVFPIHMEFLVVGWLVQFAMAIAFWILPRFSGSNGRGDERLVWAAFILLNAGILLAASEVELPKALVVGRALEAGAVLVFVLASWKRVKPHGV